MLRRGINARNGERFGPTQKSGRPHKCEKSADETNKQPVGSRRYDMSTAVAERCAHCTRQDGGSYMSCWMRSGESMFQSLART